MDYNVCVSDNDLNTLLNAIFAQSRETLDIYRVDPFLVLDILAGVMDRLRCECEKQRSKPNLALEH